MVVQQETTSMENCIVLVVYLIQKLQDLLQLRFLEHTLVRGQIFHHLTIFIFLIELFQMMKLEIYTKL